jgi:hypothetical protein
MVPSQPALGAAVPSPNAAPRGAVPPEDEAGPPPAGAAVDPLARFLPAEPPKKPIRALPPRPRSAYGNRDWVIGIECRGDAVVLLSTGATLPLANLYQAGSTNPLQEAVRQMIARRQASVRPGEPPYRPQIRFLVRPNGFRSYYLAYPALEGLQVPMSRQNLDADEDAQQRLQAQ